MCRQRTGWNARLVGLMGAVALGLASLAGLLLVIGLARTPPLARADGPTIRYVAPPPLGDDAGNDCTGSGAPCATIQHAVDQAAPGDEVRVATGVYTDLHVRPRADVTTTGVVTQVVYLDKTLSVRGGYTTTAWTASEPVSYPTTLDARGAGRVFYITGDVSPTLEGLNIARGDASGLGGENYRLDRAAGGGIYAISATLALRDSQLLENFAIAGGGLYLLHSPDSELAGNALYDNQAGPWQGGGGFGGGAWFEDCPRAALHENVFEGNRASWDGGLAFVGCPDVTLVDNLIRDNVANHVGGGMKHRAGLSLSSSDRATLIGNTISGNSAANWCGGVCFTSSDDALLAGNTIAGNRAGSTGFTASEGAGLMFMVSRDATLIGNTIRDNRTNTDGGGLYVNASTLLLRGNEITNNQASQGGGLYLTAGSVVSIDSTTIFSNTAHGYPTIFPGLGGGICLLSGSVAMTNTVVAANQALDAGSGVYVQSAVAEFTHATLARNNRGVGSAVHVTGTHSAVTLTNTILVSHTVGITVAAGSTATLEATLWGAGAWANGTDWGGAGAIDTGTINLWGDPAFLDPDAGDYHIWFDSAAVDAGVDAGVELDMDGDPRPMGRGRDLGADEIPAPLFLPLLVSNPG